MRKPTRREKDPTGQAGNRLKAKADIARRIRSTRPQVLALLDSFPVQEITINKVGYRYDIDPQRMDGLFDVIARIMSDALNLESSSSWFFKEYTGKAWDEGTAQAVTRLKTLTESVAPSMSEAMSVDSVLSNPQFTRRFEIASARTFENMKGFAGDAAKDLGFIMGNGIALGESPRIIARDIRKKFTQIEGYRALRIARTEVNNAFTTSRDEVNQDARDNLGLDVRVMHVSALVDSTRRTHAERHGKLYLPAEQKKWWNDGSNKINCLCSTVEVIYIDGEPTNKKLIKRQQERGKAYFAMRGGQPKG